MIREVHVYGKVAELHGEGQNASTAAWGSAWWKPPAKSHAPRGYAAANVISAVGTRAYYRALGFEDAGLYQRRPLAP